MDEGVPGTHVSFVIWINFSLKFEYFVKLMFLHIELIKMTRFENVP